MVRGLVVLPVAGVDGGDEHPELGLPLVVAVVGWKERVAGDVGAEEVGVEVEVRRRRDEARAAAVAEERVAHGQVELAAVEGRGHDARQEARGLA